jgi:hypothetical protein
MVVLSKEKYMIITEEIRQARAKKAYGKIIKAIGTSVRVIDPALISQQDNSQFSHLIEITTDEPLHVAPTMEGILAKDPDIKSFNTAVIMDGHFDWASDTYIKPVVYIEFLV